MEGQEELEKAIVGHKIVAVDQLAASAYTEDGVKLTLDNGKVVKMRGFGDCCAYAEVSSFLFSERLADHVITSVKAEDDYQTWFILADMAEVLELNVSWSEGSGYYSYGFTIEVEG